MATMALVRRIARPMLASIFIAGGIDTYQNPGPRVAKAERTVVQLRSWFPQLPDDPEQVVKLDAAAKVAGGVLLATGRFRRLASLGLATSLAATTVAGHPFWKEKDATARAAQRTQFLKNVGLLGGLLLAAVDTEGKPSLGWRARRRTAAVKGRAGSVRDDLGHSASDLGHSAGSAVQSAGAAVQSAAGAVLDKLPV